MTKFTENSYRDLIKQASARFRFLRFEECYEPGDGDVALWRHDVDFSPQRAFAQAKIEAHFGVFSTYYVQLSSRFYSLFDPEVHGIIRKISGLGHDVGLHFDPTIYTEEGVNFEGKIAFEAGVLAELSKAPIASFTIHNPSVQPRVMFDKKSYAGLINGTASALREIFNYCSDSNGFWRFRSLHDVVGDASVHRLYALTHPEWWQKEVMPPRERLQRCIDGRARSSSTYYDSLLRSFQRKNIR